MSKNILISNNFGVIRLLLATVVMFVHIYEGSGRDDISVIGDIFSSGFAVKAFFVLSGILIYASFDSGIGLRDYFWRRFRRIYPPYFFVVVFFAFALGLISNIGFLDYVSSYNFWKYLGANLIFLNFVQPSLPGVFLDHHVIVVNASLWTLKIEVLFYLMVPIICMSGKKFGDGRVIFSLFLISCLYSYFIIIFGNNIGLSGNSGRELMKQFPGQLIYFVAGIFIYKYDSWLRPKIYWLIAFAVIYYVFRSQIYFPFWVESLSVAAVVYFFGVGFVFSDPLRGFDVSYGVYICHFPILQFMLDRFHWESGWNLFLSVVVVSFTAAAALFNFIEAPVSKIKIPNLFR